MNNYAKVIIDQKSSWIEIFNENVYLMDGDPLDSAFERKRIIDIDYKNIDYLIPVEPSKVIGLGWNYKDLIGVKDSYLEPIVFLKSPTSITGDKSRIKFPKIANKVWVEVELVIIIGKTCFDISPSEANEYILGHAIGSDITALNVHQRDWHLARSKALDDFAPIGPNLIKGMNTENLWLKSYINGKLAQSGNTSDRVLNDKEIVSLVSKMMTLQPGDVIFTGTPAKAREAQVLPGDLVTHEIENIGDLTFEFIK
tara:strand:+ start:2104 stop:2868 length:765 start_codon:yes stop_codon:yes gene_type:complete